MANPCPHGNTYDVNCGTCGSLYLAREEGVREGYAECQRDAAVKLRQLFDSAEAEWFIGKFGLEHVGMAKGGDRG